MPAFIAAAPLVPPAAAALGKAIGWTAAALGLGYGAAKGGEYLGNQMAEADNDADQTLDSNSATTACTGNCAPDPNSECGILYKKIADLTRELNGRRADMLADRPRSKGGLGMYELYRKDPFAKVPDPRGIRKDLGNWTGHMGQIAEKRVRLQTLLAKYRAKKCTPLPPGAEAAASLTAPLKPFNWEG